MCILVSKDLPGPDAECPSLDHFEICKNPSWTEHVSDLGTSVGERVLILIFLYFGFSGH